MMISFSQIQRRLKGFKIHVEDITFDPLDKRIGVYGYAAAREKGVMFIADASDIEDVIAASRVYFYSRDIAPTTIVRSAK